MTGVLSIALGIGVILVGIEGLDYSGSAASRYTDILMIVLGVITIIVGVATVLSKGKNNNNGNNNGKGENK